MTIIAREFRTSRASRHNTGDPNEQSLLRHRRSRGRHPFRRVYRPWRFFYLWNAILFNPRLLSQDKLTLERMTFRQGNINQLPAIFPGLQFDLIVSTGVLSSGGTWIRLPYLKIVDLKTALFQHLIDALTPNLWAATLACSVTSTLDVFPPKLTYAKELLWEDAPREGNELLINWKDWGVTDPVRPAWLAAYTHGTNPIQIADQTPATTLWQ